MIKKYLIMLGLSFAFLAGSANTIFAATSNTTVMENCGAYLFEWRPVSYENGKYFAILVGGDTISENNVILNRGYDYNYTFNPSLPRPWGTVPDLVNINGIWGIPENWAALPQDSQPASRLIMLTNNKKLPTNERYVDIVKLPSGVSASSLPPDVKKYLINVDGSDAGAYDGTVTSGWTEENGIWYFRKPDGTLLVDGWLDIDENKYYLDAVGVMLTDIITPDGYYVNAKGEKTNYIPGWSQNDKGWMYIKKNGYNAASAWVQDIDGKWYYFNIAGYMEQDTQTPDGFYVDANGVWDGQASTQTTDRSSLGPGALENDEKSTVTEELPNT